MSLEVDDTGVSHSQTLCWILSIIFNIFNQFKKEVFYNQRTLYTFDFYCKDCAGFYFRESFIIIIIIIIILPHLRSSGLLWSHASVWRVLPKIFILLVGNGEFGMRFLTRAVKEHDFSSYICNFLITMTGCIFSYIMSKFML